MGDDHGGVAVVVLVISTPVNRDYSTVSTVAENLRWNAEVAEERARAIEALDARNWAMLPPLVHGDGDYADIVIYFAKPFGNSDEAEDEVEECGCREHANFSLLWNWDGTFDPDGHPNYQWGVECP